MKTWIIPLAVLMVVPALGAAYPIYVGPVPEQLVEGHTVFTILEVVNNENLNANRTEYAAAVAVLVREKNAIAQEAFDRFPGVLWFNDQYLVDPAKADVNNQDDYFRYPCTGAVLAVNQGDPDPRPHFYAGGTAGYYIESYLITDPNDHTWNVDKWSYTDTGTGTTTLIWTVAILGLDAGYDTPDDGYSNCEPYSDNVLANHNDPRGTDPTIPRDCSGAVIPSGTPDPVGTGLGCDTYTTGRTDEHPTLKYNALLYFFIGDLTIAGADKDHTTGSADYMKDGSGCEADKPTATPPQYTGDYPCPQPPAGTGDDNAEGNSHPYNPFDGLPICAHCTGSGNHGGSGATGAQFSHATRNIDLYFGYAYPPGVRNLRVVDTEGSLAPYHCAPGQALDAYHPESDTVCS